MWKCSTLCFKIVKNFEMESDRALEQVQDFSKCRALWCIGHLACGILVSPAGIELMPLAAEVLSPNHCTTREFPLTFLIYPFHNLVCVLPYVPPCSHNHTNSHGNPSKWYVYFILYKGCIRCHDVNGPSLFCNFSQHMGIHFSQLFAVQKTVMNIYIHSRHLCIVKFLRQGKGSFPDEFIAAKCESNLWKMWNIGRNEVWEVWILHWTLCELRPGWKEAEVMSAFVSAAQKSKHKSQPHLLGKGTGKMPVTQKTNRVSLVSINCLRNSCPWSWHPLLTVSSSQLINKHCVGHPGGCGADRPRPCHSGFSDLNWKYVCLYVWEIFSQTHRERCTEVS